MYQIKNKFNKDDIYLKFQLEFIENESVIYSSFSDLSKSLEIIEKLVRDVAKEAIDSLVLEYHGLHDYRENIYNYLSKDTLNVLSISSGSPIIEILTNILPEVLLFIGTIIVQEEITEIWRKVKKFVSLKLKSRFRWFKQGNKDKILIPEIEKYHFDQVILEKLNLELEVVSDDEISVDTTETWFRGIGNSRRGILYLKTQHQRDFFPESKEEIMIYINDNSMKGEFKAKVNESIIKTITSRELYDFLDKKHGDLDTITFLRLNPYNYIITNVK